MNKERLQGEWSQLKGRLRTQWGKLTDDDVEQIKGNVETLQGRLQELYGRTKEDILKEVDDWMGTQPPKANKPVEI